MRGGLGGLEDVQALRRLGRERHATVVAARDVQLERGDREREHDPRRAGEEEHRAAHDRGR